MHWALFAEPSQWDTTASAASASFERYAQAIGLDSTAFARCMSAERYRANVDENQREGIYLGVTGTPTFIINGKLLAGAYDFSVFKRAIETELKTAGRQQ